MSVGFSWSLAHDVVNPFMVGLKLGFSVQPFWKLDKDAAFLDALHALGVGLRGVFRSLDIVRCGGGEKNGDFGCDGSWIHVSLQGSAFAMRVMGKVSCVSLTERAHGRMQLGFCL